MARAERLLWSDSVYRYERKTFESHPDGSDRVVIGPVTDDVESERSMSGRRRLSIGGFVAQQVNRESHIFELTTTPDPIAKFDPMRLWVFKNAVHDHNGKDEVELIRLRSRGRDEPPKSGYLRPETLDGNRSIYFRRQNLLTRLEGDLFLLQAVTEPESVLRVKAPVKTTEWFQAGLDESKKRIIRRFKSQHPLLLVQGPPGTGKTQLATEVVMQTLFVDDSENRPVGAQEFEKTPRRVLITSQSHDPLDNLLERVEANIDKAFAAAGQKLDSATRKSVDKSWQLNRPISVRLVTEHRINMLRARGETDAVQLYEKYEPGYVARRMLNVAEEWSPAENGSLPEDLISEWKKLLRNERSGLEADLQRRLIACANVVYATANDASITSLEDSQTFDLLIFEEAAKAYALELLGPMRLARRWLLIGDHNQLPPFAVDEFGAVLSELFNSARETGELAERNPLFGQIRKELELPNTFCERAGDCVRFFRYLHGMRSDGHASHDDGDDPALRRLIGDRLDTQWRMAPDIGDMLRETGFYRFLKNAPDEYWKDQKHDIVELKGEGEGFGTRIRDCSLVWIDTPASTRWQQESEIEDSLLRRAAGPAAESPALGGGYTNDYEVRAIIEFLKRLRIKRNRWPESMMILAPYKKQVSLLQRKLIYAQSQKGLSHLCHLNLGSCVSTVDSAQGREAEIVIGSLVRNNPSQINLEQTPSKVEHDIRGAFGFLDSNERSGVMFSRAQTLLVIVGCSAHFSKAEGKNSIAAVYDFIMQASSTSKNTTAGIGLRVQGQDLVSFSSRSGGSR